MGAALANGLWLPGQGEPMEWHTLGTVLGASASDSIGGLGSGKRQPITFRAANPTERDALSGLASSAGVPLVDGDQCYTASERAIYAWGENGWSLSHTFSPVTWTPDWATNPDGIWSNNVTIGDGSQQWTYMVAGDLVDVVGIITCGSTTSFPAAAGVPFPLPYRAGGINVGVLGEMYFSGSGGESVGLVATWPNAGAAWSVSPRLMVVRNSPLYMSAFFYADPPINAALSVHYTYTRA